MPDVELSDNEHNKTGVFDVAGFSANWRRLVQGLFTEHTIFGRHKPGVIKASDLSEEVATAIVSDRAREVKIAYDGAGNITHFGRAAPGSNTFDAVWEIRRLNYDGAGNPTGWEYADGNGNFDNIWDNYASLSYF